MKRDETPTPGLRGPIPGKRVNPSPYMPYEVFCKSEKIQPRAYTLLSLFLVQRESIPLPERIDFRPEVSDEANFRHEKCLSISEGLNSHENHILVTRVTSQI